MRLPRPRRSPLLTHRAGTGKTLAYLLPALQLVARSAAAAASEAAPVCSPLALCILPVRELALQVAAEAQKARKALPLRAAACGLACVHGGVALETHAALLEQKPVALLVGTPGRLRALLEAGLLSAERLQVLVLDEADKILRDPACSQDATVLRDAAFAAPCAATLRVLLLSATMPSQLTAALPRWLGASFARVGAVSQPPDAPPSAPRGALLAAAASGGGGASVVEQEVQLCAEHKKPRKLLRYLDALRAADKAAARRNPCRVLVFCNSAATARFVAELLRRHGHRTGLLHGHKAQSEREAVLAAFRCGQLPLLVATDVASRGLHISGLERVVCWDFPPTLEAYCHRVGRAGRAGAPGASLAFITRSHARVAPALVRLLREAGQPVEQNLGLLAQVVEERVAQGVLEEEPPGGEELDGGEDELDLGGVDGAAEDDEELLPVRKPLFGDATAAPVAKRKRKAGVEEAPAAKTAAPPFSASAKWAGARKGFFFGKGASGVGYYADAPKKAKSVKAKGRH